MEGDQRIYRRVYEFDACPFRSTEDLASYAEWLVAALEEETGVALESRITVGRGVGRDDEIVPAAELRERADELSFSIFGEWLFVEIWGEGVPRVTFTHRGGSVIPDDVSVEGDEKSMVVAIRQKIQQDGDERQSKIEKTTALTPERHSRFLRAWKGLGGKLSGLSKNDWLKLTITGTVALVLGTFVAHLLHLLP